MGLGKNKKGTLQDIIVMASMLLVMSIVILIVFKISDEFNTKLQSGPLDGLQGEDNAKNAFNKMNNLYSGTIDNSMLLLAVGLGVVALMLAMLVVVHPIFIVFYFIMLTIVIFVCGVFSNVYQEMAAVSEMTAVANQLVFTSHIMEFLPFIVGIFGFIIAIVMYKTYQARSGG